MTFHRKNKLVCTPQQNSSTIINTKFPVYLRIYDLSNGKAAVWSRIVLRETIQGIWHTGIQVFDLEYFYGGGIDCMPSHQVESCFSITIVENRFLGHTSRSKLDFEKFLMKIYHKFTPETYDLLRWNCNHFTDACARYLLGDKGIPEYILNLPETINSTFLGSIALKVYQKLTQGWNPITFSSDDPRHPCNQDVFKRSSKQNKKIVHKNVQESPRIHKKPSSTTTTTTQQSTSAERQTTKNRNYFTRKIENSYANMNNRLLTSRSSLAVHNEIKKFSKQRSKSACSHCCYPTNRDSLLEQATTQAKSSRKVTPDFNLNFLTNQTSFTLSNRPSLTRETQQMHLSQYQRSDPHDRLTQSRQSKLKDVAKVETAFSKIAIPELELPNKSKEHIPSPYNVTRPSIHRLTNLKYFKIHELIDLENKTTARHTSRYLNNYTPREQNFYEETPTFRSELTAQSKAFSNLHIQQTSPEEDILREKRKYKLKHNTQQRLSVPCHLAETSLIENICEKPNTEYNSMDKARSKPMRRSIPDKVVSENYFKMIPKNAMGQNLTYRKMNSVPLFMINKLDESKLTFNQLNSNPKINKSRNSETSNKYVFETDSYFPNSVSNANSNYKLSDYVSTSQKNLAYHAPYYRNLSSRQSNTVDNMIYKDRDIQFPNEVNLQTPRILVPSTNLSQLKRKLTKRNLIQCVKETDYCLCPECNSKIFFTNAICLRCGLDLYSTRRIPAC